MLQVARQVAGKCLLKLPAQVGKLQVASKLQGQVGRQVAGNCWLKLPAQVGNFQVASKLQGQVGRQVAGSSWQASCWLKLAIFQVKLTCKLSAIGGTGDHELSS